MEKVKIEKLDYHGKGICHINNKICFVENALPDEIINIKTIRVDKKYNEAEALEYLETSKDRVKPLCKYYECNKCGGCDLQHISYECELKFKQNKINEIFNKFCNFDNVENIISSDKIYNYRNKATLKVKNGIGFYKRNSHELININYCYLVSKRINDIIDKLNINLNDINELTIRCADKTMLIINSESSSKLNDLDIDVDNIIVKHNNKYTIIKGNNYIIENLNNIKYQISLDSFFQINKEQTIKLYDEIIKKGCFKETDNVLDLYCGTGSISLYIANKVKHVTGIEINKNAIIDANNNKHINNIKNVDFECMNANNIKLSNYDVIIVDPPRNGLDNKTINILKDIKAKKIIYVSCNPITLVRDINLLKDLYVISCVTPIDMFPRTEHVECVCVMELR